jgi:hypothetical protein
METLFVLLYWPVVGLLILFVCLALLRMGVGPWWTLLSCLLLWYLYMDAFDSVVEHLHLHGRLVQILGFVYGQRNASQVYLPQLLYTLWTLVWLNVSTRPAFRRIHEERRKKKAAKAALAGGMRV